MTNEIRPPVLPDRDGGNTDAGTPVAPARRPYTAPVVQPLGEWSALTLVTSLPIGPGGMVFGGPKNA